MKAIPIVSVPSIWVRSCTFQVTTGYLPYSCLEFLLTPLDLASYLLVRLVPILINSPSVSPNQSTLHTFSLPLAFVLPSSDHIDSFQKLVVQWYLWAYQYSHLFLSSIHHTLPSVCRLTISVPHFSPLNSWFYPCLPVVGGTERTFSCFDWILRVFARVFSFHQKLSQIGGTNPCTGLLG